MGMLLNGVWTDQDDTVQDGAYIRASSTYDRPIPAEMIDALSRQPGRFTLIVSMSCPWSHRALLVRAVKRLSDLLPIHVASGPRLEGYPVSAGAPWTPPGLERAIVHLHELYTASDPHFTGRVTVPLLWDSASRQIVSNDSAQIMRALDAVAGETIARFTLRPAALATEIDELNDFIYDGVSNAVYRAGFAQTQSAYDEAVDLVFASLERLEARLEHRRFLFASGLTESDLRLFPTLVRFDAVYAILARCSLRRLVDHPSLWAYARDLYAWPHVAGTVDMDAMRRGAYEADRTHNPYGIVAVAPDVDWHVPSGRERLGPAQVFAEDGVLADRAGVPG
jgi:glutathionyl-hydroquinone reductase